MRTVRDPEPTEPMSNRSPQAWATVLPPRAGARRMASTLSCAVVALAGFTGCPLASQDRNSDATLVFNKVS